MKQLKSLIMEIVKTYKFRQFIEEMNQYANHENYSRTYMPDGFFCNVTWEQALKQARYGIKNQAKIEKIISRYYDGKCYKRRYQHEGNKTDLLDLGAKTCKGVERRCRLKGCQNLYLHEG